MAGIVELEDILGTQLALASMGLGARPRLADRYEIVALRGRGARGLVCRVTDLKLGRDVALKVYASVGEAQIAAEVIREARALAKLEHPNIVGVLDFGQAALDAGGRAIEVVYLCMEFIDGRSLRTWRAERPRSTAEVLDLLAQAGTGLAAAHGVGIVHRDFKPENVMIDARGRVLVVDFGLASARWSPAGSDATEVDHGEPGDRLTRLGVAQGTIEYMAPESRRGIADARSDQFSFAMAAWESLTGQLPFDAHESEWRRPGQTEFVGARGLAPAVREVLERGLAFFPNERFPSMVALLQRLTAARGARRRVLVGAFAGLGLLAVGTAGAFVTLSDDTGALFAAAEESSARTTEVEGAAVGGGCGAAVGKWRLETLASGAVASTRFDGVRGWYEVDVQRVVDGCEVEVHVAKVGDSSVASYGRKAIKGRTATTAKPASDGGVELSFNVDLRRGTQNLRYRFDLALRDGQVRGDWYLAAKTPVRGFVVGVRRDDAPAGGEWRPLDVSALSDQPCPSHCRVLCPDPHAAQRCVRDRCTAGRTVTVADCAAL